MIKNKYIGMLDSGVGGLSVLGEFMKILPKQNYMYFGDTKNVPYGTKSSDEIFKYTKDILDFFYRNNVENVIFACNTTSAVAYDKLKIEFQNKLNIFPLIQIAVPFCMENLADNDTIAILATKATINSGKYESEIKKINPKINVLGIDCTGFVEIVENRLYDNQQSLDLIKTKIDLVKQNDAKKVVLGCTHYPYLVNIFKKYLPNVEYFNPALALASYFKNNIMLDEVDNPKTKFYVSKNPDKFAKSASAFFEIKEIVELVELN